MKSSRQGKLTKRFFIFFLVLISISSLSRAQGRQVIFSVTGDVPYSSSEVKTFKKQVANHNKYSPSAFFVHVGDIMSGGAPCNESVYSQVADIMKDLAAPAYIVPGDNETIDCKSAASGMNLFLKHFNNLEKNICNAPVTERQSARPENWAFTLDGVLVIDIDLVYSAKSIEKQAAEWIEQQMEANDAQVRAAVIFCHFDPNVNSSFSKPFRSAAKAFGKPVLFAHGHGHSWSTSFPFPEKNIFRMQVNMGGNEEPVQVTVTMDMASPAKAFLLKRKPWSSKTTVTMPPCVNAGSDQTIAAANTMLQGNISNSTEAFTTNWEKVSGPDTVILGNVNALATAASFSAAGTYVLRLTAESGALRKSDEVTNGAFSGAVDWAVVALEIKPGAPAPAANVESEFLAKPQETIAALPNEFVLQQNFPNPFSAGGISGNASTQIGFSLPKASPVQIKVYSINGVEVATVVDDNFPAGNHIVTFQPQHLPSGTYFYVMQAGNARQVRRLVLLK